MSERSRKNEPGATRAPEGGMVWLAPQLFTFIPADCPDSSTRKSISVLGI